MCQSVVPPSTRFLLDEKINGPVIQLFPTYSKATNLMWMMQVRGVILRSNGIP